VLFVVGRALAYGRRTALVSVVGNEVGALVLAGAVALDGGVLRRRAPAVRRPGARRRARPDARRRLRVIGGTGGLAMIGLGVGVAVTGRKD
jgi:threonine/homoserine/homoserine lactone efflux protein